MAYLEPGDVIHAGNYGRTLQGIGGRHNAFLRETLWEHVRQTEYPDAPSRLGSAYFYDDEVTARNRLPTGTDVNGLFPNLYEVELVEPSAGAHRADLSFIDQVWAQAHKVGEAIEAVRAYWRGDLVGGPVECLTVSDLKVLRVVQRSMWVS